MYPTHTINGAQVVLKEIGTDKWILCHVIHKDIDAAMEAGEETARSYIGNYEFFGVIETARFVYQKKMYKPRPARIKAAQDEAQRQDYVPLGKNFFSMA